MNIEKDYINNIEMKVLGVKRMHMHKLAQRKDLQHIMVVSTKDSRGNPAGTLNMPKKKMTWNGMMSRIKEAEPEKFEKEECSSKMCCIQDNIEKVLWHNDLLVKANLDLSSRVEELEAQLALEKQKNTLLIEGGVK